MKVQIIVHVEPNAPKCRKYRYRYIMQTQKGKRKGEGFTNVPKKEKSPTYHIVVLRAVIEALERMNTSSYIEIYTRDFYFAKCHEHMKKWVENGWKRSNGKVIANIDLWQRIYELEKNYEVYAYYDHTQHYFN